VGGLVVDNLFTRSLNNWSSSRKAETTNSMFVLEYT
jgi:hypothetical protein